MYSRMLLGVPMVVLLVACSDSSPSTPTDQASPLYDFANGPPTPGNAGVFRVQGRLAFFIVDQARGLMSFHGIDTPWSDLCTGIPPTFDPVELQIIFTPAGAAEAVFTAGQHTVLIYPAADLGFSAGPEDCAIMASLPLLARGPASFIRTDNDFFGSGGPRANAFGWQAHGVLQDLVSGGEVGYTETVRFLIDQTNPPEEIAPLVVAISLRADSAP